MRRATIFVNDDEAVDAMIGYRVWLPRISNGVVTLHSIKLDQPWRRGSMKARCGWWKFHPHSNAPCDECDCGFWVMNSLTSLRHQVPDMWSPRYVVGEVAAWGNIVMHETGLRSEFAKVHTILMSDDLADIKYAKVAAQSYDVPLVDSTVVEQQKDDT